jgi:predicted MFS family arabinose efflux permease
MIAGAFADRSDRKRMMFLADLGRALLTALIPVSVILGGPTMAVILIVTAPMSILRAFFLAGYTASVPLLVGRAQLARANSIFEAVYSFGFIIGPAIAGFLAATIGPGLTLAIDAASFGLSSLALAFMRRDLRAPVDRPRTGLVADIREGISFIVHHPILRPMILFWALVNICLAPLVAALTVHIKRDLGQDETVLGLVLTAYGIGTVIGALLTARTSPRAVAPLLLGGTLTTGILLAVVSRVDQIPILLGAAAVAGSAQSMVLVTYLTARTNMSPDALLGRIGSTARTLSLGLQPVGLLAGGALIDLTDGSTTIAAMGLLLVALTLLFAPVRALRRASVLPSSASAG